MSESDKKLIAIAGIPLEETISPCSTEISDFREMNKYKPISPKTQEAIYRWMSLKPKKN
jgi:hypothetical protein